MSLLVERNVFRLSPWVRFIFSVVSQYKSLSNNQVSQLNLEFEKDVVRILQFIMHTIAVALFKNHVFCPVLEECFLRRMRVRHGETKYKKSKDVNSAVVASLQHNNVWWEVHSMKLANLSEQTTRMKTIMKILSIVSVS